MTVTVTYMELRQPPAPVPAWPGREEIRVEKLSVSAYLALYQAVGEPLHWDQRTRMPINDLEALLSSSSLSIYVLREAGGCALGLCEFDRTAFPEVELKNFGLISQAYGRGLGPWLLGTALAAQWQEKPVRIWLHTDSFDHPAAMRVYQRAGFSVYAVREEPWEGL